MRQKLVLVVAFILAAGAAGPVESQQELPGPEYYHFRGEYLWWWPKLGATIQKGATGTATDVTSELGVTDQRTWEARGTLRAGTSHKLSGTYTSLDYDGDVTEHPTVRYGSQTFFPGTRLVTSMKGGYYGGQYQYDFAKGTWGFMGGLAGARLLDLEVLLVAPVEARREQESVRVWRPIIGVSGRGYLGKRASIAGTLAGLTIGSRGYVIEFEATLQIHLFDRLAIKGGYRSFKVKDETDSTLIEFRDNGGIVGVELSL
jgi:hypothetical protein